MVEEVRGRATRAAQPPSQLRPSQVLNNNCLAFNVNTDNLTLKSIQDETSKNMNTDNLTFELHSV